MFCFLYEQLNTSEVSIFGICEEVVCSAIYFKQLTYTVM